jgi:hypothetical protein
MITTTSKNNSFICVEEVCEDTITNCMGGTARVIQQVHPLRKYLQELWVNISLFLEADKWDHNVTLRIGESSHYTMKMHDIEARWRNK